MDRTGTSRTRERLIARAERREEIPLRRALWLALAAVGLPLLIGGTGGCSFPSPGGPVVPIEDIVQRLEPYSRPRDPVSPVPGAAHEPQESPNEAGDSSDRTA